MLMSLGPVVFHTAGFNLDGVGRDSETAFAWHEVLGGSPIPEHVGEGEDLIRLSAVIYPREIGGLSELSRLQQARAAGEPLWCFRGDGRPLGWVVIERVTVDESFLDRGGAGQKIAFEIELRAAAAPSAASFFSIFGGLL